MAIRPNSESNHEVTLPHGTIRYRDSGSGEPLLFVHGFLVNGNLWRKVVPDLTGDFRCIVPDWPLGSHEIPMNPGADMSPPGVAKLIVEFVDALGLDQVTLVGNDSGGAVCQLVVANYPQRVARLVLTPCDCYENFPPKLFRYLVWCAKLPGAMFLLLQSLRVPALRRLPTAFGLAAKYPIDTQVMDAYLSPSLSSAAIRRDLAAFMKNISPRDTLEASRRFPELHLPVLLVWPREERIFPYEQAKRLAAAFPNSRLEPIDNSYTFVPEDQPAVLARLMKDFLHRNREIAGYSPMIRQHSL